MSNEQRVIQPLNPQQLETFVEKLGQFRETLASHEQAALDVLVLRAGMSPEPESDVAGYDGGSFDPEIAGIVPWRYAGPPVVAYTAGPVIQPIPVGYSYAMPIYAPWGPPATLTQLYRARYGVW